MGRKESNQTNRQTIHRKPDVYIWLLQLRMHIFRLVVANSPAAAFQ